MPITCADIPNLPGLESIRLRAGFQGAGRVVRWPYVAENDSICSWVRGGELVFVTGINHRRSAANLRQLVQEAYDQSVAGVVILTGPEFIREIHNSVLALANELGFPLLEQPYDLKMVIVTEVISNAIVQDNLLGQSVRLFLTRLINGFAETPELIHLRARELGLCDANPYALLAVRINGFEAALQQQDTDEKWHQLNLRNQLEQALNELLKRRGIEWPVLVHQQDLLVIWPTAEQTQTALNDELTLALRSIQRQLADIDIYIGVSELQPGLTTLATAAEQASQSVQFAIRHQHQRIIFNEQLGIARLFAAIPQRSQLASFCQQQLGPLCFARDAANNELKQTLTQYLNSFGNQQQASELLGIHRNTLSHRLKKLEQLLGFTLNDPFRRLNLQNALLIEQILFQHQLIDTHQDSTNQLL